MKISIITPTHNKAALLERTLRSVREQEYPSGDFEMIVVDDGSTDQTPAVLASHTPAHGFKTIKQEVNHGRARSRNLGLAQAEGELVVFLDDDMELVPGFLQAHAEFHRDLQNAMGVGNVINHPEVTTAPIDRYMSTRGAQKIKDRVPLPWKYFTTNNSSVRKRDLDSVGHFDENFVYYGFEDLELAWRLTRDRRLTVGFVPEARSFHIHPHSLEEVLKKKTLCGRSSLPYLFKKHPETRRALGFHRFDPPRAGDPVVQNLKRRIYRLLLTPPVYALVKPIAGLPFGRVTECVLDYLVQYHYLEGLKHPLLGGEAPKMSP